MTRPRPTLRGPRAVLAALTLASGVLPGCASLPDTRGYTAATLEVKQAVGTSGEVVREELRAAIAARATAADDASVKRLEAAWSATAKTLDAMVAYAQSIEQIVDAGNRGAESAQRVASSVQTLAASLAITPATAASAPLVQLATDTVEFVAGEYARHRSARSLEEALDRFGPSMAQISTLIQAQLADTRRLFGEQVEAQLQELQAGSRYGDWLKARTDLDARASDATKLLLRALQTNDASAIAEAKARLGHLETAQKLVAPHVAEYEARLQLVRQREKAGSNVLAAAQDALAAWGNAHQQVVTAVRERQPVSVDALTAAVFEVKALTRRWREI